MIAVAHYLKRAGDGRLSRMNPPALWLLSPRYHYRTQRRCEEYDLARIVLLQMDEQRI